MKRCGNEIRPLIINVRTFRVRDYDQDGTWEPNKYFDTKIDDGVRRVFV